MSDDGYVVTYNVTLYSRDGDLKEDTVLPFVPFTGMLIEPDWSSEYLTVQAVLYNRHDRCFEAYLV